MPHAQGADPAALDQTLSFQLLERELDGPRRPVNTPHERACVQLLPRRARQQRQQSGFGRGAAELRHAPMVIRLY